MKKGSLGNEQHAAIPYIKKSSRGRKNSQPPLMTRSSAMDDWQIMMENCSKDVQPITVSHIPETVRLKCTVRSSLPEVRGTYSRRPQTKFLQVKDTYTVMYGVPQASAIY